MNLIDFVEDDEDHIIGLKLIYEQSWSTYSEARAIQIYEDPEYSDMFYVREGGVNPYYSGPYWEEPELRTSYDVMVLTEEWDKMIKEFD